MILGRPTNLWNGLVVAAVSLISIVVMQLLPDVDSEVVATIGAATSLFLGTVIAIVANQPPTVNSGDTKEWRLASLTQAIPANGKRLYVTANIASSPTDTRTLIFRIPILNDAGSCHESARHAILGHRRHRQPAADSQPRRHHLCRDPGWNAERDTHGRLGP